MTARSLGAVALALVACTGGGDPTPSPSDGGSYSSQLGAEPDFSAPASLLTTTLYYGWDEVSLAGAFAEAPPLTLRTETAREGSCRLLGSALDRCSPGCEFGQYCIGGTCQDHPDRIDRGALTWTFPGGEQSVDVVDDLLYYNASGTLTTPWDAEHTVRITGTDLDLDLAAPAVPPPAAEGDWARELGRRDRGEDVTLTWSDPIQPARVRLFMTDCAGSHGGIGEAELECEGPDTGSLTLPGAFLDALDDADWSHGECGSHALVRYHSSAPEGDDSVRHEVTSKADFFYRPDM